MTLAPDPFASVAGNEPLVSHLRDRIAAEGPITFREFMAAALYHERWGYYATNPLATSRQGDYVTSPEAHSAFGAIVARQLGECWRLLGSPAAFDVVEQGAGRGVLARDVLAYLRAAEPELSTALRYRIVEPFEQLREVQARMLDEHDTITWCDVLPAEIRGVIVTNELLDAFPVHRVVRRGNDLLEVFVAYDDRGGFHDYLAPASTPALHDYFDALGLLPGEGCYAEINLDAARWVADASASLDRGYVLTFDYGYGATELYAPWRRDGTLLCFYRQSASSDPYQRIGKQDITASIDFTTLRRASSAAGLRTLGFSDQSSYLLRMGIGEALANVAGEDMRDMEEYLSRRNGIVELIDPAGLGRIRVLLQAKDAPTSPLRGFDDADLHEAE